MTAVTTSMTTTTTTAAAATAAAVATSGQNGDNPAGLHWSAMVANWQGDCGSRAVVATGAVMLHWRNACWKKWWMMGAAGWWDGRRGDGRVVGRRGGSRRMCWMRRG